MSSLAGTIAVRPVSIRRARVLGLFFVLVAILVALVLGLGSQSGLHSRFQLNEVRNATAFHVPDLVVPSRAGAFVIAGICAFLGGIQLTRGFGRRVNLVLGVVVFLLVFAVLTWAARDR